MRSATMLMMLVIIATSAGIVFANEVGVDWKLFGAVDYDDGNNFCFFDASGIVREPSGFLRVWTKCLSEKEIAGVDVQKQYREKITDETAQKIVDHYVPPFALVREIDASQALGITQHEVIANIANITPKSRVLIELNCHDQMVRELSLYVRTKYKPIYRNEPQDWQYSSPETNGNSLLKILCQKP